VQGLQVELVLALQFHEPHRRPRGRLRDRRGVPIVVLLRLHVRPHIFRRHQPHLVPLRLQDAAEMVRTAAGLHRHHATWQIGSKLNHRLVTHASTQHNGTCLIDSTTSRAGKPTVMLHA
jgi:hypothetical protein